MESVRVRGCVGRYAPVTPGAPAGKPMPVAGETVHVRRSASLAGRTPITVRLSGKSCLVPVARCGDGGRRPVVADKLRTSQQAGVGSKTRSAGRTPLCDPVSAAPSSAYPRSGRRADPRSHCQREVHMDVVVTRSALRGLGAVPRARRGEARRRLEKHDHRIIRVEVEVECERNPRQPDRAVRVELTALLQGTGDPRPRPPPRTRWPRSTSPSTRWPRRCAVPPTGAGCTAAGTRPVSVGQALAGVRRRRPDDAERRRGDRPRAPGRPDRGDR